MSVSPSRSPRIRAFEIEADGGNGVGNSASGEYRAPSLNVTGVDDSTVSTGATVRTSATSLTTDTLGTGISSVGIGNGNSSIGIGDTLAHKKEPGALDYDNAFSSGGNQDPHAADLGGDLTSAVLGIVKAMVGPAILYLPHGFVAAGYLVALPIMAISTVMYLHSSKCLLEVWRFESQKELVPQQDPANTNDTENPHNSPRASATHAPAPTNLSYPDLAHRAFGRKGETAVKLGIGLMQEGVCLTYLIFVPHNLHSSLLTMFNLDLPPNFYLFLMVCLQVRLSFIQDIRKFTRTNALANACILYGLLICLYFAFGQATAPYESDGDSTSNFGSINSAILPVLTDAPMTGPLTNLWQHFTHLAPLGDHWILFIGTSVLLFEGSITLLLPLQQAVDDIHREQFPSVYRQVILAIQVFYVIFAVSCWMSFGDSVNTVLTTSLPPGFLATTVQLAYSVAVLFTFPLQNYPALEIASKSIQQYLLPSTSAPCLSPPTKEVLRQRHIIASILICFMAIVAVTTMESLDKVVSLTGALIGIPIAFMIPPMIHSQLMATQVPPQRLLMNNAVTVLGGVAMVVASITTILQWND